MIQIGNALNDKKLDPPIKSLFVWNSDIANCAPDSISVRKGLKRKDLFTVVHETFWTDSCDYADIVLPADTQLEHMDLHAPYGHYYFSLTQPAIKPLGESKSNQDLFRDLAKYMGYKDKCFKESDESMIKNMIDPKHNPLFTGVTFEKLKKNGWVKGDVENKKRDYIKKGWPTKDGKIQIYSKDTEKIGLGAYPEHIEEFTDKTLKKKYPIQILSPATHQFIGNSFVPVERLRNMASRPTIEMSSKDANKRKIKDGDLCKIYNDVGETYAHAVIIDSMLEGVASNQKQYKGSLVKNGVNANALNTQDVTDMGDGPIFYTVLAQIKKA
jgi:anaerobic selenocysteine-containing dehydrogenase